MKSANKTAPSSSSRQSPAAYLRQIFLERKSKNGAYSTRAFARDLGISQALLSLVLNNKRPLSAKQAAQISVLLNHTASESQSFLETVLLALPQNSKGLRKLRELRANPAKPFFTDHAIERFKIISQWYHVAILDLATTANFRPQLSWIARRLGISILEARDAIDRLVEFGFLERVQGGYRKAEAKMYFATQRSEPAVRSFHRQMIAKAQAMLDKTGDEDFSRRDISAITIAARGDRIPEAKIRIKKFQQELAEFLTAGECDEVLQLNIQLFPLTQSLIEGEIK